MTDYPYADGISPARVAFDRAVMRLYGQLFRWTLDHWLSLMAAVDVLFLAGALANPFLVAAGAAPLARAMWNFYHLFCAQVHLYYLAGHPVALCQRDLAIYTSMLVGMWLFSHHRRWLPALALWGYAVLAMPMAVDGFSQLFGWRESTIALRTLTGILFGLGSIWFLFPSIEGWVRNALRRFDETEATPGIIAAAPVGSVTGWAASPLD